MQTVVFTLSSPIDAQWSSGQSRGATDAARDHDCQRSHRMHHRSWWSENLGDQVLVTGKLRDRSRHSPYIVCRQASGANIKIADLDEGSQDRHVTISGTPEQIQLAEYLIHSR